MPSSWRKMVYGMNKVFLILLFAANLLSAQDRPTLGLALSGGGAKGLAHIGVIQELENAGIYPDLVSGTSMGSIVGGLYAIGYSPSQLKRIAGDISWTDYFSDSYASSFVPIEQRRLSQGYQLSFPIDTGGIVLPRGLLEGRKIQTLLSLLFSPARNASSFDDFPLPFRAIATDIVTGEAYTFRDGEIQHAIRASMAIPSIFAPVSVTDAEGKDRLLVDGLVVRNLPASDAIDLGADLVLAVDVGAPLAKKEELNNIISILQQTADFGSIKYNEQQRELADFIIDPDLGEFTAISYDSADSIVKLGAASTRAALPELIRQLESSGIAVPMEAPERKEIEADSLFLTGVRFECDDPAATRILEKLFYLGIPGLVTNDQLENQINKLYGSNFFTLINFSFLPTVDGNELIISAKPVLDWQMRLSVSYDSDYEIAMLVNLSGRNVIGNGSLLSFDARISQFPRASLDYILYTQTRPSIGVHLSGSANFYPGRLYDGDDLISEFRAHHFTSRLAAFSGLGENRYLEAGLFSENLSSNDRFITLVPTENILNRQAFYAELVRDTYDRAIFPRKGARTDIYVQRSLGGREKKTDADFNDLGSNLVVTATHRQVNKLIGKVSGILELAGGFVQHNRRNVLNQLYLGRPLAKEPFFFNVYGKRHMELAVSGFVTAAFGLRLEAGNNNFIGLHYQYGRYAISEERLVRLENGLLNPDRFNENISGFALTLGSDTFLGPLQFNAEYDPSDGSKNYNLHFGYYF
ncbi:hypothetical protein CEQ90_16745 [Lewinellaceae bacterium SD302]|nr:hypothetical protein CEQ90_16745 [Lewinellaceae bacterium SD302]